MLRGGGDYDFRKNIGADTWRHAGKECAVFLLCDPRLLKHSLKNVLLTDSI
jgi:hypothetical protein